LASQPANSWPDNRLVIGNAADIEEALVAWMSDSQSANDRVSRIALVHDPTVAGIASEFYRHGQLVRINMSPRDLSESNRLADEWTTLATRLSYHFRVEAIALEDPRFRPWVERVASALKLPVEMTRTDRVEET